MLELWIITFINLKEIKTEAVTKQQIQKPEEKKNKEKLEQQTEQASIVSISHKTESKIRNSAKSGKESSGSTETCHDHSLDKFLKIDKSRYDKDFLMKLRFLATENPDNLPKIPNVTITTKSRFIRHHN